MLSCKKNEAADESVNAKDTVTKVSATKEAVSDGKDTLNSVHNLTPSYLPQTVIPFDKAAILANETNWATNNKDYIVLETSNRYYVDLDIYYNAHDDTDMGVWLGKYDDYIVFPECYWLIESRHKILLQDEDDTDAVLHAVGYKNITYNQLISKLNTLQIPTTNHYDSTIKVTLGSTLTITKGTYSFEDGDFSIPLINAIIANHNLTNPTLSFSKATIDGHIDATFFKLTENGNVIGYYDFSHRPPFKML